MNYLEIKLRHVSKTPIWWLMVLVALFIGLFWGLAGQLDQERGDFYYIGLVDYDQSVRSQSLIEALESHPSLELVVYDNRESAHRGLVNKEVLQTYILLEGFEGQINDGAYDGIIEVVSMIESPYSDWLNDQISVSVIREWLISDGYHRIFEFNPAYPRVLYEEAFEAYYAEHELLIFKEVDRSQKIAHGDQAPMPYYVKGFLWLWCFYLFVASLWMTRKFYLERQIHLLSRLKLSGVSLYTYLSEYIIWLGVLVFSGGLGSYFVLSHFVGGLAFSPLSLIYSLLSLGLFLLLFSYVMSHIPFALNQVLLLCVAFFIIWCLMSSSAMAILPVGEFLTYGSPVTLFFKFFT